jgi:hypothetical protein
MILLLTYFELSKYISLTFAYISSSTNNKERLQLVFPREEEEIEVGSSSIERIWRNNGWSYSSYKIGRDGYEEETSGQAICDCSAAIIDATKRMRKQIKRKNAYVRRRYVGQCGSFARAQLNSRNIPSMTYAKTAAFAAAATGRKRIGRRGRRRRRRRRGRRAARGSQGERTSRKQRM